MRLRPPSSTLTYTLFPYTTLFRSVRRVTSTPLRRRRRVQPHRSGTQSPRARSESASWPPRRPERQPNRQSPRSSRRDGTERSEEHTSELQSLMRISYAVFCLKKKNQEQ